jgi:hypothetical protein
MQMVIAGIVLADAATFARTMKLWAMGDLFRVTPAPNDIDVLCKAVKAERSNALNYVHAADLVVYNFKDEIACEEIEIPGGDGKTTATKILSAGNKVYHCPLRLLGLVYIWTGWSEPGLNPV